MTSRSIANEHQLKLLITYLNGRKRPFSVEIVDGRNRSEEANRLSQKWYAEIAEQTGEDREDVRARCKLEIDIPIMREASDKFRATYDRLIRPLAYDDKLALIRDTDMPVTRLMNVGDMSRYMDEVFRRHAEFGIVLTIPPDRFAFAPPAVSTEAYEGAA
ncbi:MAG: hypothetical protein ACTHKQ_18320 [Mesorhizobium sp.]